MGAEQHVVEAQQRMIGRRRLVLQHVDAGGPQPAAAQGIGQRRLVDQAAASGVDHDRTRLHPPDRRGVDQVTRGCGGRQVQADDVGLGQCRRQVRRRVETGRT
jgi:hypothetical protein